MTTRIDLVKNSFELFQEAETIYKTLQNKKVTTDLTSRKEGLALRITACEKQAILQASQKVTKIYTDEELDAIFKNIQYAQAYLDGKKLSPIQNGKENTTLSSITNFFHKVHERFSDSRRALPPTSTNHVTRPTALTISNTTTPSASVIPSPTPILGLSGPSPSPTKPSSDFITSIAVMLHEDKTIVEKTIVINTLLQNLEKDCLNRVYNAILEQSTDPQKGSDQSWAEMHIADSASLLLNVLMDELPAHLPTETTQPVTPSTAILNEMDRVRMSSSEIFVEAAKCLFDPTTALAQKAEDINDLLLGVSREMGNEIYSEILTLSEDPAKGTDVEWAKEHIADDPRLLLDVLTEKLPYNTASPFSLSTKQSIDPYEEIHSPTIESLAIDSEPLPRSSFTVINLITQISSYFASSEIPTSEKVEKINFLLQWITEKIRDSIYAELLIQSVDLSKGTDLRWAEEHIADNPALLLNILMDLPTDTVL